MIGNSMQDKICPKCFSIHNKNGKYCSRKCSNSRIFSNKSKEKTSQSLKKYYNENIDQKNIVKNRLISFHESIIKQKKEKSLERILTLDFNLLSWQDKRRRIIHEQINKCNCCSIDSWNQLPITLEIDHRDGDNSNNTRENLEGLCPNCHSQTKTWRGRNKTRKIILIPENIELIKNTYAKCKTISKTLKELGLAPKGDNYANLKRLLSLS